MNNIKRLKASVKRITEEEQEFQKEQDREIQRKFGRAIETISSELADSFESQTIEALNILDGSYDEMVVVAEAVKQKIIEKFQKNFSEGQI